MRKLTRVIVRKEQDEIKEEDKEKAVSYLTENGL